MLEIDSCAPATVASPERAAAAVCPAMCATRCAALGDLPRGRQQLADGGADLAHGGGLLLGRRRLLVGGGLQLGRGAADLADGTADLTAQGPREQRARSDHACKAEQGAQDYDRFRAMRIALRFLLALLQEPALLGVHVIEYAPQIVHGALALAAPDQLHRLIGISRPAQVDRLLQFREFAGDERLDHIEALLLMGIVLRQFAKLLEHREHLRRAGVIGVQEGLLAGDDVAPLPGLRILEQAEDARNVLQHLVRVGHPPTRARELGEARIGHHADGHQQHQRQRESSGDLSSESPVVNHECHPLSIATTEGM